MALLGLVRLKGLLVGDDDREFDDAECSVVAANDGLSGLRFRSMITVALALSLEYSLPSGAVYEQSIATEVARADGMVPWSLVWFLLFIGKPEFRLILNSVMMLCHFFGWALKASFARRHRE
jgi:hypothetical protein